jgi:hypothetical protein
MRATISCAILGRSLESIWGSPGRNFLDAKTCLEASVRNTKDLLPGQPSSTKANTAVACGLER